MFGGSRAYCGRMTELTSAVVLVAGATGGLGSRLQNQLAARGAVVVGAGRGTGFDLRDEGATARLIADIRRDHDRLDGVVIAAGNVAFGPAEELADATIRDLFDVNALGPIRLIRDAMPLLAESGQAGHDPFIVTLSGIVAETPTAGLAAYSAAKSALAAFVTASSRELRKAGIRIVDARPGHIETELSKHPIAGVAPTFPPGLDPDAVAERIVNAIVNDERDLPSSEFG